MLSEALDMRRVGRCRSAMRQLKPATLHLLIPQIVLLGLFCALPPIRSAAAADQRESLPSLLIRIEASYAGITDYTTIFQKQERLDGKLLPEETMFLKFQKPLKVYMKWMDDPHKGNEALYVEGNNRNKLIVHHQAGLLGFLTLSVDPRGFRAMKRNRHPITEVGFGHLIEGLQRNIKTALQHGELEIIRMAEEPFHERAAIVVEAKFTPRSGRTYYTSRMVCHIDKEVLLPVGAAFYDKHDVLFERYSYSDVKLNVGLTPLDFSRENKAYRF